MTREEIKAFIKPRLLRRYVERYRTDLQWGWNLIKYAVTYATPGERAEIVRLLDNASMVKKVIDAQADQEAENMLANDSLDLAELARILGDN